MNGRNAQCGRGQKLNLLVFGLDNVNLSVPPNIITSDHYELRFESYVTQCKFSDFDGVLLFQGIFESHSYKDSFYHGRHIVPQWDRNQLDRRDKELQLLFKQGGFACFLLYRPFVDGYKDSNYNYHDLSHTDLTKRYLPAVREDISPRSAYLDVKRDEFRDFLGQYGAASTYFTSLDQRLVWRTIAECNGRIVAAITADKAFFLPTLLPQNDQTSIESYFILLCDSLVECVKTLNTDVPSWVSDYHVSNEADLIRQRAEHATHIEQIDDELKRLNEFKRTLALKNDPLVDAVLHTMKEGFKLAVHRDDVYREDFELLDEETRTIALVEVKGTNKGVKREYINQADNHRERARLSETFPSILIINTNVKGSSSINNKDQEVASEQIKHATKMNVLILRTLDLLELLRLYLASEITRQQILDWFCKSCGWLKVTDDEIRVVQS